MLTKMSLNNITPIYDFHEVHSIAVNAPPARVYDALKAVTSKEIFIFRALISIRALPAKILKKAAPIKSGVPLLEEMCKDRFVILSDNASEEIVFGVIGRFWEIAFNEKIKIKDVNDFIKFDKPMYMKAAANLRVESQYGKTLLTTETRVVATSKEAKRKFGLYWIIIRLGSGFIRRMWLKAIKRRAEAIIN